MNCLIGFDPGFFHHFDVFGVGLFRANLYESAAHLFHHEFVAEGLHGIQLAVVPGAFQELQHQHSHALAHGAEGSSHCCRGFAFSSACVHNDQTAANVIHNIGFRNS